MIERNSYTAGLADGRAGRPPHNAYAHGSIQWTRYNMGHANGLQQRALAQPAPIPSPALRHFEQLPLFGGG
jgi:hypothetical protein